MPVLDGGGLVRNHHSVAERIFVDSGIVIDPVVARLERGFPAPGQELFTVDIDFGRPLIRFTVETGDLVVVLAVDPAAGKLGRSENRMNIIIPNSTAPITLKSRWITAARFAVLVAPALESSAVTQVPMFCPSVM